MSCCGRQRGQFATAIAAGTGADTSSGPVAAIRYVGDAGVTIRGPATGRNYRFSTEAPVQRVAMRDTDALLRSRLFRRA